MREEVKGTYPLAVYDIKSGASPVEGDMIAIDSSKDASPATDAAGLKVAGVAIHVNTDTVEVRDGVFAFANSGTHALDRDDRGTICYVEDKDTVSSDPGSHVVVAGVVVDVYDEDVYVDMSPAAIAAATGKNPVAAVVAALTLTSMTGTANAAPAAETNLDTLGGTLTGTLNQTMADVAATAAACAGAATPAASDVDTAIATAVGSIVTGVNKNLKELQHELAVQKALNTVLINDAKTFATQYNAILTALKTAGLMASA